MFDLNDSGCIEKTYTPESSKRITKAKPTLIGHVAGTDFYEHPILGDESPMIARYKGTWCLTCFWDLPTEEELDTGNIINF